MINKYDFILASATIFVALVWFIFNIFNTDKGNVCQIYINNSLYDTVVLQSSDGIENIIIDGEVILKYEVKNGHVDVIESECRDKLCVRQHAISRDGESIVCLPQKIVFMISSDKENEFDGFTY